MRAVERRRLRRLALLLDASLDEMTCEVIFVTSHYFFAIDID